MVFSSFSFLLLFFPLILLCYFLVPKKLRSVRNGVLLIFSLAFYFFGEPSGIYVMLFVVVLSYLSALLIASSHRPALCRLWLIIALAGCLGILCYYKYAAFAIHTVNRFLHTSLLVPDRMMPIGISFFTFQSLSYVIDVYRGKVSAQKNPLYVALYVALFPQLIAGPIVRYSTVAEEITYRNETFDGFYAGLSRFILGLGKKLLLANPLGSAAAVIFGLSSRSALIAWAGAALYALQIFFDFSGYSDMAIGLGRIFGFHFLENFNYPYISRSITEFWRRWHISLGSWFRDYVYIPLGGNRRGLLRQLLNILIVWALTGLWHGASWNFVLWGLYFAAILILEKLFLKKLLDKLPGWIGHSYALLLILVGWVIFNCTTLTEVKLYLASMVRFDAISTGDWGYLWYLIRQYWPELAAGVLLCMPVFPALKQRFGKRPWAMPVFSILLLGIFALCLLSLSATTFNPFIYFRF